jgi:hypothetical protein
MPTDPLPSPADLELVFHAALKAGDAKGVEAALMVMAPQDPQRAQRLFDLLEIALEVAPQWAHPGTAATIGEVRDAD